MSKKDDKYNKKVTISLTEKDHSKLKELADDDRRTINQFASFLVEDGIDSKWVDNTPKESAVSRV